MGNCMSDPSVAKKPPKDAVKGEQQKSDPAQKKKEQVEGQKEQQEHQHQQEEKPREQQQHQPEEKPRDAVVNAEGIQVDVNGDGKNGQAATPEDDDFGLPSPPQAQNQLQQTAKGQAGALAATAQSEVSDVSKQAQALAAQAHEQATDVSKQAQGFAAHAHEQVKESASAAPDSAAPDAAASNSAAQQPTPSVKEAPRVSEIEAATDGPPLMGQSSISTSGIKPSGSLKDAPNGKAAVPQVKPKSPISPPASVSSTYPSAGGSTAKKASSAAPSSQAPQARMPRSQSHRQGSTAAAADAIKPKPMQRSATTQHAKPPPPPAVSASLESLEKAKVAEAKHHEDVKRKAGENAAKAKEMAEAKAAESKAAVQREKEEKAAKVEAEKIRAAELKAAGERAAREAREKEEARIEAARARAKAKAEAKEREAKAHTEQRAAEYRAAKEKAAAEAEAERQRMAEEFRLMKAREMASGPDKIEVQARHLQASQSYRAGGKGAGPPALHHTGPTHMPAFGRAASQRLSTGSGSIGGGGGQGGGPGGFNRAASARVGGAAKGKKDLTSSREGILEDEVPQGASAVAEGLERGDAMDMAGLAALRMVALWEHEEAEVENK